MDDNKESADVEEKGDNSSTKFSDGTTSDSGTETTGTSSAASRLKKYGK